MEHHTLIIGGTGMLKEASRVLASKSHMLTSVARTTQSLQSLDAELHGFTGVHHMLALDWSDPTEFLSSVARHVAVVGIPSLVVAWLHDDGLAAEVATCVSSKDGACRFFQIRSCTVADPASKVYYDKSIVAPIAGVTPHQIILGFDSDGDGSRWLSDSEISTGVLSAIERQDRTTVVGTVSPWEMRP
jgi:hypothetical protein